MSIFDDGWREAGRKPYFAPRDDGPVSRPSRRKVDVWEGLSFRIRRIEKASGQEVEIARLATMKLAFAAYDLAMGDLDDQTHSLMLLNGTQVMRNSARG